MNQNHLLQFERGIEQWNRLMENDPFPIDFSGDQFNKSLDFTGYNIVEGIDLSQTRIQGDLIFSTDTFEGAIESKALVINGDLIIRDAGKFTGGFNLKNITIQGQLIVENCEFQDEFTISDAVTIDQGINLSGCIFRGHNNVIKIDNHAGKMTVEVSQTKCLTDGEFTLNAAGNIKHIHFSDGCEFDSLAIENTDIAEALIISNTKVKNLKVNGGQLYNIHFIDNSSISVASIATSGNKLFIDEIKSDSEISIQGDFNEVDIKRSKLGNLHIRDTQNNICITDTDILDLNISTGPNTSRRAIDSLEIDGTNGNPNTIGKLRANRAKFESSVNITGMIFEDEFNFNNAEFYDTTRINDCAFNCIPLFHNATLHVDTKFTNNRYNNITHADAPEAYRTLKHYMHDNHAYHEENEFFALELKSNRKTKKQHWAVNLLDILYEWTSDYGQSVLRPLIGLVFVILGFSFLYYCLLNFTGYTPNSAAIFTLTLDSTLPFYQMAEDTQIEVYKQLNLTSLRPLLWEITIITNKGTVKLT